MFLLFLNSVVVIGPTSVFSQIKAECHEQQFLFYTFFSLMSHSAVFVVSLYCSKRPFYLYGSVNPQLDSFFTINEVVVPVQ